MSLKRRRHERSARFRRAWKKAVSHTHYLAVGVAALFVLLTEFSATFSESTHSSELAAGNIGYGVERSSHFNPAFIEGREAHSRKEHETLLLHERPIDNINGESISVPDIDKERNANRLIIHSLSANGTREISIEDEQVQKIEEPISYSEFEVRTNTSIYLSTYPADQASGRKDAVTGNLDTASNGFANEFGLEKATHSVENRFSGENETHNLDHRRFLSEASGGDGKSYPLSREIDIGESNSREASEKRIEGESAGLSSSLSTRSRLKSTQHGAFQPETVVPKSMVATGPFRGVLLPAASHKVEHLGSHDNITQISYMLYRLIRTHRISSIADIPCIHNLAWMPAVLHQIEFITPGFRFICVVRTPAERERAQAAFGHGSSAEFFVMREFWRAKLPEVDLAFLWNVIGFMSPQRSWALIKGIRRGGTKYLLLPNYPDLRNNPAAGTHHGHVNVRRAPYRFTEALRVFNNVSTDADISKQMLLYDSERLREHDV